jgi:hypothetical protein
MGGHAVEIPPEVKEAAPGALGALVALRWYARYGKWQAASMFVGGCALSYFGSATVAGWLSLSGSIGLTGFLLGMLGMAVVAKIFDLIDQIDPVAIWTMVRDWIARKLG